MTGADDGLPTGTSSGDAYTFEISRRIVRHHMVRTCPQCPTGGEEAAHRERHGADAAPLRCPAAQFAAHYVRRHHAEREWLRAAVQIADELREVLLIGSATAARDNPGEAGSVPS